MNETVNTAETETNPAIEELGVNEMDLLKERAKTMGLRVSPKIGLDALKKKIQDALDGNAADNEDGEEDDASDAPAKMTKAERINQTRQRMHKEQMRLVRLRIANLNPNKADLGGEIFTFVNKYVGAVRKFVPYGEVTENGYHVPFCIYNEMKNRKFLSIKTRERNGQIHVSRQWVPEFALEVLDPLTPEELKDLANQQAAAGSIG